MNNRADRPIIDRYLFAPHYLSLIANVLTSGSSREYLSRYGVGLNEARIITVLGHVPGLTPPELSTAMAMNKSIVSRSLASLMEREFIRQEGTPRALHNYLTEAGSLIHDRIVPIALGREEALLAGITPEERRQLLQLLVRMLKNTESMKS
jgi:DNA-binding MarR family transcriptional regulator